MKITLFYDHVTILDYAYLDDHRGPIGNSLIVDVGLIGETDKDGILYDFSYAKKKVKEIIDRDCDHRLVIPRGVIKKEGERATLNYAYGVGEDRIEYSAPLEAFCELDAAHVSFDNIKVYLEKRILEEMPKNVLSVQLKFRTEKSKDNYVYFHYTHGLKDHYGNCQRLLHGHKSTLKVFENGQRNFDYEEYLAKELFSNSIHFAFEKNIQNIAEIKKASADGNLYGRAPSGVRVHLKYEGNQGTFEGKFPGKLVYILQEETTVENLSIHFAKLAKEELSSEGEISVLAYEGIGKGARTTL